MGEYHCNVTSFSLGRTATVSVPVLIRLSEVALPKSATQNSKYFTKAS